MDSCDELIYYELLSSGSKGVAEGDGSFGDEKHSATEVAPEQSSAEEKEEDSSDEDTDGSDEDEPIDFWEKDTFLEDEKEVERSNDDIEDEDDEESEDDASQDHREAQEEDDLNEQAEILVQLKDSAMILVNKVVSIRNILTERHSAELVNFASTIQSLNRAKIFALLAIESNDDFFTNLKAILTKGCSVLISILKEHKDQQVASSPHADDLTTKVMQLQCMSDLIRNIIAKVEDHRFSSPDDEAAHHQRQRTIQGKKKKKKKHAAGMRPLALVSGLDLVVMLVVMACIVLQVFLYFEVSSTNNDDAAVKTQGGGGGGGQIVNAIRGVPPTTVASVSQTAASGSASSSDTTLLHSAVKAIAGINKPALTAPAAAVSTATATAARVNDSYNKDYYNSARICAPSCSPKSSIRGDVPKKRLTVEHRPSLAANKPIDLAPELGIAKIQPHHYHNHHHHHPSAATTAVDSKSKCKNVSAPPPPPPPRYGNSTITIAAAHEYQYLSAPHEALRLPQKTTTITNSSNNNGNNSSRQPYHTGLPTTQPTTQPRKSRGDHHETTTTNGTTSFPNSSQIAEHVVALVSDKFATAMHDLEAKLYKRIDELAGSLEKIERFVNKLSLEKENQQQQQEQRVAHISFDGLAVYRPLSTYSCYDHIKSKPFKMLGYKWQMSFYPYCRSRNSNTLTLTRLDAFFSAANENIERAIKMKTLKVLVTVDIIHQKDPSLTKTIRKKFAVNPFLKEPLVFENPLSNKALVRDTGFYADGSLRANVKIERLDGN